MEWYFWKSPCDYFEILMYNSWSSSNSIRCYRTPGVEKALLNNNCNDNCVWIYPAALTSRYEDIWAGENTTLPFLTSLLDGNDHLHASALYPRGYRPRYPLGRRLCGSKSQFWRCASARNRAPVVQFIASRYRRCALGTACPELGTVATSCEKCNDISGSVEVVEFLNSLSY
jgi:hypothetical protein